MVPISTFKNLTQKKINELTNNKELKEHLKYCYQHIKELYRIIEWQSKYSFKHTLTIDIINDMIHRTEEDETKEKLIIELKKEIKEFEEEMESFEKEK